MASDNTHKLMMAKVLNSARAANILDENDSDGVRGLILIILQQFLLLKERMPLIERTKAIKDDIEMVRESRREVKTSNGDSKENCDIESIGGCADDSEDDEGYY